MDTSTVLVSILQEMKKMTEMNAQLLTVIQQQTDLIKEQRYILNQINLNQSESLALARNPAWAPVERPY